MGFVCVKMKTGSCILDTSICVCPKLWHKKRKFAILVMSISINFVFLSLPPSLPPCSIAHHPLSYISAFLPVWRQRNALREIMVKLYVPELYFIPFDLHELIQAIVQRNEQIAKYRRNKQEREKETVTESGCN